jgi:hypothetical protein
MVWEVPTVMKWSSVTTSHAGTLIFLLKYLVPAPGQNLDDSGSNLIIIIYNKPNVLKKKNKCVHIRFAADLFSEFCYDRKWL